MEDRKKSLKILLDFIISSRRLLEKEDSNKGYFDFDIIYHLRESLNQYFLLKKGLDKWIK